jgi:hypothetical protein
MWLGCYYCQGVYLIEQIIFLLRQIHPLYDDDRTLMKAGIQMVFEFRQADFN